MSGLPTKAAAGRENIEPNGDAYGSSPDTVSGIRTNRAEESIPGTARPLTGRPMFLLRQDRLPSELRALVTHRELIAGEALYHRGDPAIAIFVVERGRVQLLSHTSEGRPVPLYVVRPGECVSEAALFADAYCGDVIAEVTSRVAVFPKTSVMAAFHNHPSMAAEFMALLTRRFNVLRIRLELRNLQSARERILQYLMVIADPGQDKIVLDRPLKTIADDLGLTHESFYRTLAQLAQEGKIRHRKGSVANTGSFDRSRLSERLNGNRGARANKR